MNDVMTRNLDEDVDNGMLSSFSVKSTRDYLVERSGKGYSTNIQLSLVGEAVSGFHKSKVLQIGESPITRFVSFNPERTKVEIGVVVAEKDAGKFGQVAGKVAEKVAEKQGEYTENPSEYTEKYTETQTENESGCWEVLPR